MKFIPDRCPYLYPLRRRRRGETWTEETLIEAMIAVNKGHLSERAASIRYNIPRRTLRDHVLSGNSKKRLGRNTTMSTGQEKEFAKEILWHASSGKAISSKLICRQAFLFCERHNIRHNFNKVSGEAGRNWLRKFLQRHTEFEAYRLTQLQ